MICGNWAIYDPVSSSEVATTGVPERQAQLQLAHCSNKSLRQVFCSMKTIGLSAAATFGS
jgi:hypothetical protein